MRIRSLVTTAKLPDQSIPLSNAASALVLSASGLDPDRRKRMTPLLAGSAQRKASSEILVEGDDEPLFLLGALQDLTVRCSTHRFLHGNHVVAPLAKLADERSREVFVREDA